MSQQSSINESPTPPVAPQPSRTGLWIALGVGGGVALVGIIIGTVLIALHFAPAQPATKTESPATTRQSSYEEDALRADARAVVNALASYHVEHGSWPTNASDARRKLSDYDTIRIDGSVLDRLTDEPASKARPQHLTLYACKDTSGKPTGAMISMWVDRLNKPSHFIAGDNCPAE